MGFQIVPWRCSTLNKSMLAEAQRLTVYFLPDLG